MLRWLTSGESHGPALVGILEGMPAGVEVTTADVEAALARRRLGYGRGARMTFETDEVRLGLSPWYVAFFHDRPGQPLASKVRHRDRDCQHLRHVGDQDMREATEAEMERLEPCGTCG